MEKFVDASTWALGSHPQKGQIGNLTPKPTIQQKNKKLISKFEKVNKLILKKDVEFVIKNK